MARAAASSASARAAARVATRPAQRAKPARAAPPKPGRSAPAKPARSAPDRAARSAPAKPARSAPDRATRSAPAKPARSAPARPARSGLREGGRSARAPRARSAAGGIRWEKVGRIALLGVLGIIVLLYIPPVTHWFQQNRTAERSEQRLLELRAERARLQARLRELSGPGAIEREARKLGMTRRDERPYVVRP